MIIHSLIASSLIISNCQATFADRFPAESQMFQMFEVADPPESHGVLAPISVPEPPKPKKEDLPQRRVYQDRHDNAHRQHHYRHRIVYVRRQQ